MHNILIAIFLIIAMTVSHKIEHNLINKSIDNIIIESDIISIEYKEHKTYENN